MPRVIVNSCARQICLVLAELGPYLCPAGADSFVRHFLQHSCVSLGPEEMVAPVTGFCQQRGYFDGSTRFESLRQHPSALPTWGQHP